MKVCKACKGTGISSKGTDCVPCTLNRPLSPARKGDKKVSYDIEQHTIPQERFILSERMVTIKRR